MAGEDFNKLVYTLLDNYKKKQSGRLSNSAPCDWEDVEHLYSLIGMMKKSGNEKDLYLLVKDFISIYVAVVERRDYGYDFINFDKVFVAISDLKCRESLELLRYFKRILVDKGFAEEVTMLVNKIKKKQFDCALVEYTKCWYDLRRLGKMIIAWITKDIYGLVVGLLFLLFFSLIILLPNEMNQDFVCFAFNKKMLSQNWLTNHILNVVILFFSMSDDVAVYPLNCSGVFLLTIERVGFWIIVANSLIKEIEERYF
jgi:hypothetical protein